MVTTDGVKQVIRAGQLITVVGGSIGLLALVAAYLYFGAWPRTALWFIWPIGAGAIVSIAGMILGKFVKPT